MVDFGLSRYFNPRFFYFTIVVLIAKVAIYLVQQQTMDEIQRDTITIRKGNSSATVHLFGATLISWMPEGQETIFVSKKSAFDGSKAIRGGVPIVFPQFGPWALGPQHGFARISKWKVKDGFMRDSNTVTLVLESSDRTLNQWNYKFRFEYTLLLVKEKQLKMDVIITNTGDLEFSFTFLLHTYFSVPDVLQCSVTGLKGCVYVDKVKSGEMDAEVRDEVTISELTDRIYMNTSTLHTIKGLSGNRTGKIEKFNLPDTVVWNPWSENAKSMSDFGDDEWQNMVCVEAGAVRSAQILESSKSFIAYQILSVE